jgi:hypothetical protein
MAPTANYYLKSQTSLTNVGISIDGTQTSNNKVDAQVQTDPVTGLASVVLKISILDVNESQSVVQQVKNLVGA